MQIFIVSIGELNAPLLNAIKKEFESVFEHGFVIAENIEPVSEAYDSLRGQYRSDVLLELMKSSLKYEKILGLTRLDLFVPGLNFVFGQADLGGRVCIVSISRLDPRYYGSGEDFKVLLERAIKECSHELGHVFGLRHCSREGCVMTFSNSIMEVDRKGKSFCGECKNKLGRV